MRLHREQGSALLVSVIAIFVMLGLSTAFFMIVLGEANTQHSTQAGTDAFYVAEAGLAQALMELRTGEDIDGDGTVGSAAGTFHGSPYAVSLTDMGDGTLQLVAVATVNGTSRAVEVRVTSAPPVPLPGFGAQAALAILGKLGKKGKVDLHLKKPWNETDDVEGDWTSDSTSPIAVDGTDAAGVKPDLPGLGIEDSDTFNKVSQKIAEDILKGKIPEDAFLGTPNTIVDKKGNPVSASVYPLQTNPTSLNYENMNVIADQLEVYLDTSVIPSADVFVSGADAKISVNTTWGTPTDPQVVVIDANKATVQPNVEVSGYGTLVVQGDLSLLNNSKFDWHGEVIIMGGTNKDAVFKNKKGHLNVDGMVLVLGTNETKGKSKLELHNDIDFTNDSTTTINGPLLVWTGNNSDKEEKAEFKAKHGNFDINGFIGVYGDKTKLDVKIDDKKSAADGGFIVHGGIVVAVPGSDEKHKAKVHLHGDDILIQYDSVAIENAISALLAFANQMPDPFLQESYQIVSWRRIVAPNAVPVP